MLNVSSCCGSLAGIIHEYEQINEYIYEVVLVMHVMSMLRVAFVRCEWEEGKVGGPSVFFMLGQSF